MTSENYILYSVPVKLRTKTFMIPPMSMYHLRKLLELRDSGADLDNPSASDWQAMLGIIIEVIQENHPSMTPEGIEKELDIRNIQIVIESAQSIPKNVTPQTGTTKQLEGTPDQAKAQK